MVPALPRTVSVFKDTQLTLGELLTEVVAKIALMALSTLSVAFALRALLPPLVGAILVPFGAAATAIALAFLFAHESNQEQVPFDQAHPNASCGMRNRTHDGGPANICWVNSDIQLLRCDQAVVQWFLKAPILNQEGWAQLLGMPMADVPENHRKYLAVIAGHPEETRLGYALLLSSLALLFKSYEEAHASVGRILEISAQMLCERLSALTREIHPDPLRQEDAAVAFSFILELSPPEFLVQMEKRLFFNLGDHPPILDNPEAVRKSEEPNRGFLALEIGRAAPDLRSMFREYCNEKMEQGNGVIHPGVDGVNHRYDIDRTEFQFKRGPGSLWFQLKRFRNDGSKNEAPITLPDILEIETIDEGALRYQLDGFIVHRGDSLKKGHYITYTSGVNRAGRMVWYKNNDSVVTQIDANELEQAQKQAYIPHYKKI